MFNLSIGLYGKVDEIPEVGHVATKFLAFLWFPVIPMGSFFVTQKRDDGWEGAKVGWSLKSILVGYLRTFSVFLMIGGGVMIIVGLVSMFGGNSGAGGTLAASAIFLVPGVGLFYLLRVGRLRLASHPRACKIGDRMGFDQRLIVLIDLMYGVIDQQEAEARLAMYDAVIGDLDDLSDEFATSNIATKFDA